jgi:hypothetical protein
VDDALLRSPSIPVQCSLIVRGANCGKFLGGIVVA